MPLSPRSVQLKCLAQVWVCVRHRHSQSDIDQASLLKNYCSRRKQLCIPTERITGWKALRLRRTISLPRTVGLQAYPLPPWVHSLKFYSKAIRTLCGLCSLSKCGFLLVFSCKGDLLPEVKVYLASLPGNMYPGGCTSRRLWLDLGHNSSRLQ